MKMGSMNQQDWFNGGEPFVYLSKWEDLQICIVTRSA
jgi:hypothetical protein